MITRGAVCPGRQQPECWAVEPPLRGGCPAPAPPPSPTSPCSTPSAACGSPRGRAAAAGAPR
eukprot:7398798-Lingulodinium_polyedra.AAC.1